MSDVFTHHQISLNDNLGLGAECSLPVEMPSVPSHNARAAACHGVSPVPPYALAHPIHNESISCAGIVKPCSKINIHDNVRNKTLDRYTDCMWESDNQAHYGMADRERIASEKLRINTWQSINGIETRTLNRQLSNTKKLGDRTYEISFWKEELLGEINSMHIEIRNLVEHKRILEKCISEAKTALAVAEESMLHRDKRVGVEECHDEAERKLTDEIRMLRCYINNWQLLAKKAGEQLKMNRRAMLDMEIDARDKHHAQSIDDRMHRLNHFSNGLAFYCGVEKRIDCETNCETWVENVQHLLENSRKARTCSDNLRGQIDGILRKGWDNLWSAYNQSTQAFKSRIEAVRSAKENLEDHFSRINNEIKEMSRTIALVRKCIADKERPLMMATTRLQTRTQKIGLELTCDPVTKGLVCELEELRQTVVDQKDFLRKNEIEMCRLLKTRATLQENIAQKENCIQIDQRCVLSRRPYMAMDPCLGDFVNLNACTQHC